MTLNRTITPQTQLPSHLNLPPIALHSATNGIKLYALDAGESDVVRLSLVFHCGSRHQQQPFTASATLNMLSEGTKNLTSAEIAERLDFYGIFYDTSTDRDFSIITVNCLSRFLDETIDLLTDIMQNPLFSESELEIYKTKRREQLRIEREKPSYLARELFSRSLFGESHPYGFIAPSEAYDTLTTVHLRDFYDRYFTADNCFAVVSGRVTDYVVDSIDRLLQSVSGEVCPPQPNVQDCNSTLHAHIERPEALQTSIRIGKLLFTKEHPDFNGMQVVSMILGGYFGSRLVTNLREERGYTYGIYSAMVSLEKAGYVAIATDVTAEATKDAVTQIFYEINRLRTELVPVEELSVVKNMIVGEIMRIIDGPFGIADVVIENLQSSMNVDYLDAFLQEVLSITPERVKALSEQYLDPSSFTVVTVGKN